MHADSKNIGEHISSNLQGLVISAVSLGGTPTFIPASYFADYFGRKWCVGVGSAIMVIASIVQTATEGRWAFFGTRLAIGIGLGFAQTAAPPLTTEIAHPRHRGTVTAIFQATWHWGAILAASVSLGSLYIGDNTTWSWRVPCLFQIVFPGIQLLGLLVIPESPRWLISKDRQEEALQILARYHANGDTSDPLVQYEFREICEAIELESASAHKSGWSSFVKTKGALHRLAICILVGFMIQWAGNGTLLCLCIADIPIANGSQVSSHTTSPPSSNPSASPWPANRPASTSASKPGTPSAPPSAPSPQNATAAVPSGCSRRS